jgi:uncharacterized protein
MRETWLGLLALAGAWLMGGAPASAQTVVGDWNGAIVANAAQQLRVAVHIKQGPDGAYTGTLDSLDQGVNGLVISDITLSGDTLTLALKQPAATFTGTWNPAAKAWVGHWVQGISMPLTLTQSVVAPKPTLHGLDGAWKATLSEKLHLVLHVRTTAATGTIASVDSPDQLSYGLTVNAIHRDGDEVGFEMTALGASFSGQVSKDGKSLVGQWSQGGRTTPVTFVHNDQADAGLPKRPQTPVKPYPYVEQNVTFDDPSAPGVKLAGTLTLPPGPGPFPAVVLVSGSGPNTRNEPILGHQIFLVLADHLTRNGIAVLRYDKRGTGDSSGDYGKATTVDFANDADAATAYLRSRPEIDPKRVGLIGHSEGGLIVPIVATKDPATAFIVMMAGPGVDGRKILLEQSRLISLAMGMPQDQVDEAMELRRKIFAVVASEKDPAAAEAKLRALVADYAASHKVSPEMIQAQVDAVNTDWFRYFFDYDPAPTLARVRCPVLALNGSLDLQVPPDQNLPPIRVALMGNPDVEVDELPGLNHLFQDAKTGAPGEYGQIEETISPAAMDLMTEWILKRVR